MGKRGYIVLFAAICASATDLPGSKDPPGMKRYADSEIIGYRAPKFEDFLLPLGVPTQLAPAQYQKSLNVDGLLSRYTYVAPAGRTATELLRNYKLEFQRLDLTTIYEKAAGDRGWFGPTFDRIADEDQLGQILAYNEAQERLIVGKSKAAKPTYYLVFVTTYKDGVIPSRLSSVVSKDRALAHLIVIAPEAMEEKMTFVNADEMSKSLTDAGKVILYAIAFETGKDTPSEASQPTLQEIAKLLAGSPGLKIHVVGHTDNQGTPEYNLDLSRRRAASVVRELSSKYGVAGNRLDSFGAGLYVPVSSNENESGRARNRRVELVKW